MDLVRFGVVIRALRRRRGWTQALLAAKAGVSQSLVSSAERGHADRWVLAHVIAIPAALDARVEIDLRWRAGELDRLLDADHAALAATLGRARTAFAWEVQFEVTYAVYGARGSIDLLGWHAPTRTLLVIEVKTEVTSAESTIRKLDEKVRLASQIAMERFGWHTAAVARLLIVEDTTTAPPPDPVRGPAVRRGVPAPRRRRARVASHSARAGVSAHVPAIQQYRNWYVASRRSTPGPQPLRRPTSAGRERGTTPIRAN